MPRKRQRRTKNRKFDAFYYLKAMNWQFGCARRLRVRSARGCSTCAGRRCAPQPRHIPKRQTGVYASGGRHSGRRGPSTPAQILFGDRQGVRCAPAATPTPRRDLSRLNVDNLTAAGGLRPGGPQTEREGATAEDDRSPARRGGQHGVLSGVRPPSSCPPTCRAAKSCLSPR